MRALTVVALLAACNSDGLPSTSDLAAPVDLAHDQAVPARCGGVCNLACPAGATCVVADDTLPTCAQPCTTDDDCHDAGAHCISFIIDTEDFPQRGAPYQMSPRVCLTSSSLTPCPGANPPDCASGQPLGCADATTLEVSAALDGTCGTEFQRCAHMCVPDHHCS